jgi:hypothetical protein
MACAKAISRSLRCTPLSALTGHHHATLELDPEISFADVAGLRFFCSQSRASRWSLWNTAEGFVEIGRRPFGTTLIDMAENFFPLFNRIPPVLTHHQGE